MIADEEAGAAAPRFKIAENIGRIVSNDAVNPEYRLLIAAVGKPALSAAPGQFFHIACPHAGADQPFLRRPMSVYDIDKGSGRVSFLYKVTGAGTRALATMQAGDSIDLLGPLGRGFELPAKTSHVLMLARGVGLATLAPLAAAAVRSGASVTAVLSARSPALVMSEALLQEAGAHTIAVTDTDGSSDLNRVEQLLRREHAAKPFDFIATCGSNRLLQLCRSLGREWKAVTQVAIEQHMGCGLGMCFCCVRPFMKPDGATTYRRVCWDGPVFDAQEVVEWSI